MPLCGQSVLALEGGASIATLGGADAGNVNSRTGVSVGASLTVPLSDVLGIQVGAGYVQKGATVDFGSGNIELGIDYFEVPVLLRIGIPSASSVSAHILVGPAVSFQSKCQGTASGGGVTVTVSCGQANVDTKTVDLGAMGGLGLDFSTAGRLTVTVDGLYNLGLASIDNTGGDTKNRAFTIRAGVGVPLG